MKLSVDASFKYGVYCIADENTGRVIDIGFLPRRIKTPVNAEIFAISRTLRRYAKRYRNIVIYNDCKDAISRLRVGWKHVKIVFKNPNHADRILKERVLEDIHGVKQSYINKFATINKYNPKLLIRVRW